jgi:hypothetical protein
MISILKIYSNIDFGKKEKNTNYTKLYLIYSWYTSVISGSQLNTYFLEIFSSLRVHGYWSIIKCTKITAINLQTNRIRKVFNYHYEFCPWWFSQLRNALFDSGFRLQCIEINNYCMARFIYFLGTLINCKEIKLFMNSPARPSINKRNGYG